MEVLATTPVEQTSLFNNKAHYLAFRIAWSMYVNSQEKVPRHMFLLYNLLRGKDPQSGFTCPTSRNKLENGYMPWN